MPGGRAPLRELTSPLTVLRELDAAHRALYEALRRATEALARLAEDLGRPGHFSAPGHRTPGPR